ncbi:MAG: arginine--tRNA ligase [Gemmatimonadetes bacterium]|nr:arginine--tRNA ligase [Gemmatimonadota bacterium]MYH53224.1 arginine--tRNA ligase [Gemmatimonadota bacterium]MYK67526.1 arginine--tRNA ligase [Gemmatimonadota bacterium]
MHAERISEALQEAATGWGVDDIRFRLDRPKEPSHGDLASNIALTLASRLKRPPRDIAGDLAERLAGIAGVERIEVAGPGFLNFFLDAGVVGGVLQRIVAAGSAYGRGEDGAGRRIMVEFVSANPTGPLHLGHGRQAALGDVIARLLEWSGWNVHREFYFNDAGRQITRLAETVRARYRQLLGHDEPIPEGGYHGEYVVEIASAFLEREGRRYENDGGEAALAAMRHFAVDVLRDEQKRDLAGFNVRFDEYYSERSLYSDGRVEATIRALEATGLTYGHEGALWLRTTRFGDQKDRVMVKGDGSATYFLPDVAYHMSKWERGFREVVNVQGSDHHGTVDRVRAGLQALGRPEGYPEYLLHQMVTVERGGEEVRFSKRSGSYTTLAELVDEVGADVARYFFLMRRPEAHLTFDLDLALDQSDKNPVYKVKYAHARLCRLSELARERGWAGADSGLAQRADTSRLEAPTERELINQLGEFPGFLRRAASTRAPHVICDYLDRTAGLVNTWYQAGHPTRNPGLSALVGDDELRNARLTLSLAARIVLRNGLAILGIEAPERMVRDE